MIWPHHFYVVITLAILPLHKIQIMQDGIQAYLQTSFLVSSPFICIPTDSHLTTIPFLKMPYSFTSCAFANAIPST